MKSEWIQFPLLLAAIAFVAAFAIGKIYLKSEKALSDARHEKIKKGLRGIFAQAESFEMKKSQSNPDSYWAARDRQGRTAGLAYTAAADVPGGEMVFLVGMDTAGTIRGLRVLWHKEKPSVETSPGEIASQKEFLHWKNGAARGGVSSFEAQFSGLDATRKIELKTGASAQRMLRGGQGPLPKDNSLHAVSGATLSTQACLQALAGKSISVLKEHRRQLRQQTHLSDSLRAAPKSAED